MTQETISTLDDVIQALKDGEHGFRAAAEDIDNPRLKSLFTDYSAQRARFSSELQQLERSFGESRPEDDGSFAGALHRGWIDLKSAIASRDEHAVLAECERGEDVAVDAYKKALEDRELPANVQQVLRRQFADIKSAHDHIRNLRDLSK